MTYRVTIALVMSAVLAWTVPGNAQDKADTDSLYVDFVVPDLPALAALGLNPSKISQPGNLKELSVSVFPLIGNDSLIGPGVAVAWAPVFTFARDVDSYRRSPLRRLAFSLITSKEGKTEMVNAGAGLRIILVDKTDLVLASKGGADCTDSDRANDYECSVFAVLASEDGPTEKSQAFLTHARPTLLKVAQLMATNQLPAAQVVSELQDDWDLRKGPTPFTVRGLRTAFDKRLTGVARKHAVPVPELPLLLSNEIDELAGEYIDQAVIVASTITPRLARLREAVEQERWNWAVVSADLGIVGQSATGSWSDLKGRKYGGLLSVALPIGHRSQVVAQLEGRHGFGSATETSHIGGGGRWLIGSSSKRFSAEAYIADTKDADSTKEGTSYRNTLGSEFRLTRGFWLEVAFGAEHTPAADGAHLLSLANFRYAFKSSPRFTSIPGSVDD